MLAPRSAWTIPAIPNFFDTLNFYKYITKTRLLNMEESHPIFEQYFHGFLPSTDKFEERLIERLNCLLKIDPPNSVENIRFLENLFDEAHLCIAHENQSCLDYRISQAARCESFWIRSGFGSLYNKKPIWETEVTIRKTRITGDDRRRLGELVFAMRDNIIANVRVRTPLKNIFEWSDTEQLNAPLFDEGFDVEQNLIFLPMIYNLIKDKDILWQCPGYDYDVDETHKYGRVALKNVSHMHKYLDYWNPESQLEMEEMKNNSLASTAVSSLFNWLNGQAHCLGYTQYTDIERPLTSQLILSDGKLFYFALGQLNTIAINIDVIGFENNRTNLCCVEGPFNLYDEFIPETGTFTYFDETGNKCPGLNKHVLQRILQFYCKT